MGKNKSKNIKSESIIVYGAGLGAAFGAAAGSIFENFDIAFGVSIGVALGTAIALLFGKKVVRIFGNPDKADSNKNKE